MRFFDLFCSAGQRLAVRHQAFHRESDQPDQRGIALRPGGLQVCASQIVLGNTQKAGQRPVGCQHAPVRVHQQDALLGGSQDGAQFLYPACQRLVGAGVEPRVLHRHRRLRSDGSQHLLVALVEILFLRRLDRNHSQRLVGSQDGHAEKRAGRLADLVQPQPLQLARQVLADQQRGAGAKDVLGQPVSGFA